MRIPEGAGKPFTVTALLAIAGTLAAPAMAAKQKPGREAEDLIRLHAEAPAGWDTSVKADVLDVPAGQTVEVPVYVRMPDGVRKPGALTLTAASETDSSKSASSSATVAPAR
jgi:hypothetical protein